MLAEILILGGTTEAYRLAEAAGAVPGMAVVLSHVGRTRAARQLRPGRRIGGFGGVEGLVTYLHNRRVGALVDASHPFAAAMSAHAAVAAVRTGTPRLVVQRPAWLPRLGDHWYAVADEAAAAATLPARPSRVFLALGRGQVGSFHTRPEHQYVVRSIDPPEVPMSLPGAVWIQARPSETEAAEMDFLTTHGIEVMVTRNSGGASGKIVAARMLGIPVLMIDRPPPPPPPVVQTIEAALNWLGGLGFGPPAADRP